MAVGRICRISLRQARIRLARSLSNLAMNPASCLAAEPREASDAVGDFMSEVDHTQLSERCRMRSASRRRRDLELAVHARLVDFSPTRFTTGAAHALAGVSTASPGAAVAWGLRGRIIFFPSSVLLSVGWLA